MRKFLIPILIPVLLTAGCGASSDTEAASEELSSFNVAEPEAAAEAADADEGAAGQSGPLVGKAALGSIDADTPRPPQIAYVYSYGYRLAGDRIAQLQQRHADLCESEGPQVCRIISMDQSGDEGDYVSGSLQLAIAAPQARAFGRELGKAAQSADGEQTASGISGEDLSKEIVDTEARLRARTLLRDRLMEVLASRKGTVAELVEAERGVAQVNEEIDQARSWLAEMRGRVNFSTINISYESGSPSAGGFAGPIREAFGSIGSVLGTTIAALILILTALVPIAVIGAGVVWFGRKLVNRRKDRPAEDEG